ncbi:MAG: hypothetical protein ACREQB_04750 [Candidatus Binataceae bacterium]
MKFQSKALLLTLAASIVAATVASSEALAGSRVVSISLPPAPKADGAVLEIPQACDPRSQACVEPEFEWRIESVIYFDDSKRDDDKQADKSRTDEAKTDSQTRADDSDRASQTIDEYQPGDVTVVTVGALAPAGARSTLSPRAHGRGPASAYLPSIVPPPASAPSAPTRDAPTIPGDLPARAMPFLPR